MDKFMNRHIDTALELAKILTELEQVNKKIEKLELNKKLRVERKNKNN